MYNNIIEQLGIDEDLLKKTWDLYEYVKNTYYDYYDVQMNLLYMVQDMVWYNLECDKKNLGLNTLKKRGSKFGVFQALNDQIILNKSDKEQLENELSIIITKWDTGWDIIHVYTDIAENQQKQLDGIIIHNKNESPRKYDYYKKTALLDEQGHNIYKNKEVMLGELDGKLGEYYLNNILQDKVQELKKLCQGDKFLFIRNVE